MIKEYRIKDFINDELWLFSNQDNIRSIPSLIDGFKDSQRKAIFGLLKHGPSQIKVAQAGSVAAMATQYMHGEGSMCETIVGLAQNFPGSNNVNLLEPIGQFGSILSNGSAAHRYIYTKHSPWLRKYLRREDDAILESRIEEGEALEPINYFPILPMWAVNGAIGIGTGHAVRILPRDPKKVAKLVAGIITGKKFTAKEIQDLTKPHFNGWKGEIVAGENEGQWELIGTFKKIASNKIVIDELPVGIEVDKYKAILLDMLDKGIIRDYDNNSSESGFNFEVTVPRSLMEKTDRELLTLFKLTKGQGENITLWNTNGELQKYDSFYDAIVEFVKFRLEKYDVRKEKQLESMGNDLDFLENKIRFINFWNTKLVDPHKKKKPELTKELIGAGVKDIYIDRLLSMQINSLTMELVKELEEEHKKLKHKIKDLEKKTGSDLYMSDLEEL